MYLVNREFDAQRLSIAFQVDINAWLRSAVCHQFKVEPPSITPTSWCHQAVTKTSIAERLDRASDLQVALVDLLSRNRFGRSATEQQCKAGEDQFRW